MAKKTSTPKPAPSTSTRQRPHFDSWRDAPLTVDESTQEKLDAQMEASKQQSARLTEQLTADEAKRQEEKQKTMDEYNRRLEAKREQDRKFREASQSCGDIYKF
jgi:hypothetical protein